MEKRNTLLLTVIAVATLLVAVVGATFAYFASTSETEDNLTVNATLNPNTSSFTVVAGDLSINVAPELMIETQRSTTPKATDNDTLVVTYNSGGVGMTCTYDILWVWDTEYEKSVTLPLTTDNGTYNYEMSLQSTTTPAAGSTATVLSETNIDNLTLTGAAQNILHSGEVIKSAGTEVSNTYTYTLNFYNVDADQTALLKNGEATTYEGHLAVDNVVCTVDE